MGPIRKISALCLVAVLALTLGVAGEAAAKKSHASSQVTVQTVGPDGVTVTSPERRSPAAPSGR